MEEGTEGTFDFLEDSWESVSTENIQLSLSLDLIRTIKVAHGFNVGSGGSIFSDIIVAGNMVYFGACDRNFYGVLASNGERVWRFTANDVISSTCLEKDRLIFGSYDYDIYCLDLKGNLIWRFHTRDKIRAKPVIRKDIVYIGSKDQHLYAIDAHSGKLVWKFRTMGPISSAAFAYGDMILVGSGDNNLYALDKESGRVKWKFTTQGTVASPIVHNDVAFFGCMDHNVYALDVRSQKVLWKVKTGLPIPSINRPVIANGHLYIGSRDYNMYKISLGGDVKWKFRTSHMIHAIPVVWGGVVYFGSDDQNFYAVDDATGKLRWKFKTDGPVISSPALNNGVLYFGSWDCNLYAVSIAGDLLWKTRTSSSSQSGIEVELNFLTKPLEIVTEMQEQDKELGGGEALEMSNYGAISASYETSMTDYLGLDRLNFESGIAGLSKQYKGSGKNYR